MSHLLVLDDNVTAMTALSSLLEMDGYQVTGVTSAEVAISRLVEIAFDALVTDLEMPRVHGLEVIRSALRLRPQLRVLVVTGYADSPASDEATALGAAAVLAKPLDYEALLAHLAKLSVLPTRS